MREFSIALVLALAVLVAGCGPKPTRPASKPAPGAARFSSTNLPKLWDFSATWCSPCNQLKPVVESLETEYAGKVEIRSIDVDQNKDLAQQFNVLAIPTLVFLDAKGRELSRVVGLVPRDTIVGRFRALGFVR